MGDKDKNKDPDKEEEEDPFAIDWDDIDDAWDFFGTDFDETDDKWIKELHKKTEELPANPDPFWLLKKLN